MFAVLRSLSPGLVSFCNWVLPEKLWLLAEEEPLSQQFSLSAEDLRVEGWPMSTVFLEDLREARGWGAELLSDTNWWSESITAEELRLVSGTPPLWSSPSEFVLEQNSLLSCFAGCSAWQLLCELLRLSAQPLKSKVACPSEESLAADRLLLFRYFSMSKALISAAHIFLWRVSVSALWSSWGRICKGSETDHLVPNCLQHQFYKNTIND